MRELDKLKPDWEHYLKIKEIRDKLYRIGEDIWSKHFGQPFGGAAYGEWVIDVVKGRERPLRRYQEMIHRRECCRLVGFSYSSWCTIHIEVFPFIAVRGL